MLPRNLKYTQKYDSAYASSYLANIQPNGALNGYTKGTTITIVLPNDAGTALCSPESVLKFTATLTGSGSGRLDSAGAHSFIHSKS
jgi:hypothetical protein